MLGWPEVCAQRLRKGEGGGSGSGKAEKIAPEIWRGIG